MILKYLLVLEDTKMAVSWFVAVLLTVYIGYAGAQTVDVMSIMDSTKLGLNPMGYSDAMFEMGYSDEMFKMSTMSKMHEVYGQYGSAMLMDNLQTAESNVDPSIDTTDGQPDDPTDDTTDNQGDNPTDDTPRTKRSTGESRHSQNQLISVLKREKIM
ncbi:hypothetical protein SNE40_017277 [Patella caerulea]|uniref:Uncharacterized protein n=1 Tax=Patella caerulea TaxID=87958 RepID=A0AAN8JGX0_PATCE